jgi:O-methyltransferase
MNIRSIKKYLPWPLRYLYQKTYYLPKDVPAALAFIFHQTKFPTKFFDRVKLVFAFYRISYFVDCPHTEHELLSIARQILNLTVPGIIVEAGAFHGGSTLKLSLVAKLCARELFVFDSFEGMPENTETHGKSIFGREHRFPKGSHAVQLEEVKQNVSRYGDIKRCQFFKGWLSDTLPKLQEPVAAACMNVDLVQSTKDGIKYLYPLISKGGIIFSQDGHFPWIIKLLDDNTFWQKEIGVAKPNMDGLGTSKLVAIFVLSAGIGPTLEG